MYIAALNSYSGYRDIRHMINNIKKLQSVFKPTSVSCDIEVELSVCN